MRKIFLVLRHELLTTLRRGSFLFFAFGLPLIIGLIFTVLSITQAGDETGEEAAPQEQEELHVEGYVDHSGLMTTLPEEITSGNLVAFDDEDAAREALEMGGISAYYLIPVDYVETGEFVYVHPDYSPMTSGGQVWMIRRTLLLNLLNGDEMLAERVWNPVDLEVLNLAPEPTFDRYSEENCSTPGPACESSPFVRYIPIIMVILFFLFITQGSSLLIRNISGEKQTQVMEILMASVSPTQLLAGKVIGLGIASMIPTIAWLGTWFVVLRLGGGTLNLPEELTIPTSLWVWSLVFFLLGYALYASLMAGAGALVPNLKEINQATWVVITPLFAGYLIGVFVSGEAPHGLLSTVMSMFPLTAPILMVMRLTIGGVPPWQILTAVGLMIVAIIFVVRAVAGMFRAQALLSGQPFSGRRFIGALLGKAV